MANNELTHWGIKGMKWGVRRFQNRDGSLTSEGRKRYGDDDDSGSKASANKRKSAREMSDEELFRAVNRARLEDQYNALRPEHVSTGKKFLTTTWSSVIAPAATNAGRRFLENSLNKFGDDLLKDVVDPDSISELTKTRDRLKLKNEINNLKTGRKEESWDDKIKRQTYEKNQKNEEVEELERQNRYNRAKEVAKTFVDDNTSQSVPDSSSNTVERGRTFFDGLDFDDLDL